MATYAYVLTFTFPPSLSPLTLTLTLPLILTVKDLCKWPRAKATWQH